MKNRLSYFVMSVIILTLLLSCLHETGKIAVTVYDASNDSLLSDVSVKLGADHELWGITAENGLIIFEVETGPYELRAYASMYEDNSRNIEVTKEDQAIDIFLTRVDVSKDNVAPRIVGRDVEGADLFILFSEAMNKNSFNSAIENLQWAASDKDCKPEPDNSYALKWVRSGQLKINHQDQADCSSNKISSTWELKSIRINTTPTDKAGNHLEEGYSYSP